ncbi:MAG TPA: L,D-transpeptidase, partial [Acidimicrobiales bacterium]|nr:L,D-transpeptidase [Acidimicrobiales bacterium]
NVHLDVDFTGLHLGNGVWGVDGRTVDFSIGDAHISTVDAGAHTMSVQVNGQVVNTFPVSTGRPGPTTETRSGVHVVNEKSPMVIMDSSTIGIPVDSPEGYKIEAEWSVRISNSGEFVHSAPWSVDSQGHANVSHGCVNASPGNAKWFYDLTQTGDVVQVVNTPRQLEPWNGYGDWQVPWDQWVN